MKKAVSHILLLSILVHLFYSSGYLLDYYINSEFYKANCEKKFEPMTLCNGHCVLSKRIEATQQQPGEQSKLFIQISPEYLIKNNVSVRPIKKPYSAVVYSENYKKDLYSYLFVNQILKPPTS